MSAELVKNADRMMTSAELQVDGIEVIFADGRRGLVPFAEIPGVDVSERLAKIELPNPYEVVLHTKSGATVDLSWDFVRHYCNSSYQPRIEAAAPVGRKVVGARIRRLRESIGLTQQALAQAAGVGRVTLVRIENGEQSPRYDTLVSLAQGLGRPVQLLLVSEQDAWENAIAASGAFRTDGADFKPVQIRGAYLSETVLRDRL